MKQVSLSYSLIQGAIGKRLVVKHYAYGVVITRYPNMRGISTSFRQKLRRRLFKKAVLYASRIFSNPRLREEKRRVLRRPRRLFQALMKEWFRNREQRELACERRIERWRRKVKGQPQDYLLLVGCALCCLPPSLLLCPLLSRLGAGIEKQAEYKESQPETLNIG